MPNSASPGEKFQLYLLDPQNAIKKNDLSEIKNPVFFDGNNKPTSDGLLSNEIFGITIDDRANKFAYIDLHEYFMNPVCYEIWTKMDSNIRSIVHGVDTYSIDEKGHIVKDPNGKTGIDFLRKNIDKIVIAPTASKKRDVNIEFLEYYKKNMFMKSLIVIPAYFRDVNTNSQGFAGVGEVNKLYTAIIIAVRALKESADYGLNISDSTRGRIQEGILNIYKWFEGEMAQKFGIIQRAVLSKTSDFSSRLVLSSAELKVEDMEDMMVTMDKSAIPLSSVCTAFYPFVLFHVRRMFEQEFAGKVYYPFIDQGKIVQYKLKNTNIEFSDERIKKELNRFMKGYSNRFIPIEIPIEGEHPKGFKPYMRFKGYNITQDEFLKLPPGSMPLLERKITWCDIFYQAAVEATRDKMMLITRFPIDSYFNQFPTAITVSSTKVTEPMVVNNTFYRFYPKIREEMIGSDTSNQFIDTCIIANPYTGAMGADFDGDTVTNKGVWSIEANQEAIEKANSKSNYISLGGENIRTTAKEGIQSLYSLTLVLPETKLKPITLGKRKK